MNGRMSPIEAVIELLRPYAVLLLPVFFFGFFFVTALAVYLSDRRYVTKSYVAGFLVVMLLFQTVMPIYITPIINWHKFSSERPVEHTGYEIRVVDANGKEITLDRRGTLSFNGIQPFGDRMANEYSEETNDKIAAWLLKRVTEYRMGIERGEPRRGAMPRDVVESPERLYRFPAHSTGAWSAYELREYSEFVGIRVYRVTTITSDDGTEIVSQSEELVFEKYPESPSGDAAEVVYVR